MAIVGVDNYSYHRLLGEVRPGEDEPSAGGWTWERTIAAAAEAGADAVALETVFMDLLSCRLRLEEGAPLDVMLSWGHPYGLEYGQSADAEEDAQAWLSLAAGFGHRRMRIVIAHPHLRVEGSGWEQAAASVPSLRRLADRAGALEIVLAIENHADVTAEQLAWIIDEVDSPWLRVCFDTANAQRVGDDPLTACRLLAPRVVAAHIKDLSDAPWHPRSGPTSVPLGTGTLPVSRIVAELTAASPGCWLMVEWGHLGAGEFDEQELVRADIDWLRRHAGRA